MKKCRLAKIGFCRDPDIFWQLTPLGILLDAANSFGNQWSIQTVFRFSIFNFGWVVFKSGVTKSKNSENCHNCELRISPNLDPTFQFSGQATYQNFSSNLELALQSWKCITQALGTGEMLDIVVSQKGVFFRPGGGVPPTRAVLKQI